MKLLNLFLLFAFLLSACESAATATSTSAPTQTLPPAPTATQTPSPTPTITPTPTQLGGGSGKLIFEYYRVAFEKSFPDLQGEVHVFISNLDGDDLHPVTNGLKSFNHIENISANGQMALVSSRPDTRAKGDLYLIHVNALDADPIKLGDGLAGSAVRKAMFLDETRVIYLGQGSKGYGFYTVNIDGTDPKKISVPSVETWEIVAADKTRVYWQSIQKEYFKDISGILYAYGDFWGMWWTNLDGSGQGKLESNGRQIFGNQVAFSPDGAKIAWIPANLEQDCYFLWNAFWTPGIRNGRYTDYAGKTSLFMNRSSPHFGKVIDIAYVENYVRQCFVLHVAYLSDLDNDTKIPLIPPFDPAKDDFFYHSAYALSWWPDSSKILAYDSGAAMQIEIGITDHYPLALYEMEPENPHPMLTLLKVLSDSPVNPPAGVGAQPRLAHGFDLFEFSPDGRQILLGEYSQGPYVNILNLGTLDFINDFGRTITPDSQTQRIGSIYWLP